MSGDYQIRVDGRLLSTPVAWEFVIYNGMFSWDAVPGTRSYEIKIPSTPEVRRAFGRMDDPNFYTDDLVLPADIEADGKLMDTGVVTVKADGKDYLLSFSSNLSKIMGDYTDRLISEVGIGSDSFTGSEDSFLATDYTTGYVLGRLKNEAFLAGDTVSGFAGYMNDASGGSFTGPVAVPFIYLKYLLNEWSTLTGCSFSGDYMTADVLAQALFYANTHRVGSFNFAEQLPDLRMPELLMALRKAYNLWVRVDNFKKGIRMDFVKDIITQSPTKDWSSKFGRIKGSQAAYDGINLKMATDGNDELVKSDDRFNDYLSTGTRGAVDINCLLSGVSEDAGIAAVKQEGFYLNKQGKIPTARIMYFNTGTDEVAAGLDGVDFSAADHAAEYYAEWEAFLQQGFKYEGPVNLTANEVAEMAGCFAGTNEQLPVIYAQGVNWLIEKIVVPSVGLPVVRMWRV